MLSVSNGHGEDLIAAAVLRQLPGRAVVAYPLVGLGEAYPPEVERLDPRRAFPSGGFSFRTGNRGLLADLRSGIIRFWLAQRRTLAAQRGRFLLTLAVGDVYCLSMAMRAGAPAVLVASADSVLDAPFRGPRLRVLRQARRVFTRDAPTADFLRARGVGAVYLGNPIMDCLSPAGVDFGLPPRQAVVTLLPGSRAEAAHNAALLAQLAAGVAQNRPETGFLLSLAPGIDEGAIAQALERAGARKRDGTIEVGAARLLLTHAFADAVMRATVVVGLAGTANEQAAGLGKPVVAFPGPGRQFTPQFLRLQRTLLGEAIVAVPSPEDAPAAVLRLLGSPEERVRRGQAGRERMGDPGAAARIAAEIRTLLAAPEPNGR